MPTYLFVIILVASILGGAALILAAIYVARMSYIRNHWKLDNAGPAIRGLLPKLPKDYVWSFRRIDDEYEGTSISLRLFKLQGFDDPQKLETKTLNMREGGRNGDYRSPDEMNRVLLREARSMAATIIARADREKRERNFAQLYVG